MTKTASKAILPILVLLGFALPAKAQQGTPFAEASRQYFTAAGVVCNGCKFYFYAAGTTTPQDTYSDAALTTPNTNPVVLSSAGRATIFLSDKAYKVTFTTAAGTEIYTTDYVVGRAPPANVLTKTANYTVTVADGKDVLIKCDASAGDIVVTTYTAVGNTGRIIRLKKSDASLNECVLDQFGSQTIDGSTAAITLANQYEEAEIISDGANWARLGPVDRSVQPGQCTCRLTLESGVAVSTTDQSAKGTLYLTPYLGTRVAIYNNTAWQLFTLSQVSLSLTTLGVTSGANYDIFLTYNTGLGTLVLEGLQWTNDTTRATGLTTQDGVYVKAGDATRLYVGTIRGSASNQSSDTAALRYVWNRFNQVPRAMRVTESANTWTYGSATIRQANGAAANQIGFVVGVEERPILAGIRVSSADGGGSPAVRSVGFGLDSTTAFASGSLIDQAPPTGAAAWNHIAEYNAYPGIGYHYLAWLEASNGVNTPTFYGDNNAPTLKQSGIFGTIWN